ncbi:Glycerol-3-phosphate dehydrogenase [Thalassoporum mexicanum PCC 7367]|uniref:glycerol-3-phosphate dehydrogenase n=1 Tax=Thalassoporum mexicanum TaxID=3457544 RepID=UPI00029F9BA3|nr:glycerol-3-phosphate dehydrogenase [Pseudanabaena sp. PCC 7367]AFY69138.1 Glycerol-3-phosphate dehydrogenase [Pseudanabaena sp. PCC 7367]
MRDFQAIQGQTYDLIVIGGGINGAAVARDAALRGLKPILIEKGDFSGATSSWSTRLVHGGLRYLEYFEFALVRESLHEREILLRTAPHLVRPLMLTVPVYAGRSRRFWKIRAGMLLYDIFSFDKTLPAHRILPGQKFRQLFRHMDPENLVGGAQYYDAQAVYAERICLENILSAQAAGAVALNYVQVTQLERNDRQISKVVCRDRITKTEFAIDVSPNAVVINTSGPWVDQVCQLGHRGDQDQPIGSTKRIGGTKGSHIVVDRFPGAPDSALYVEAKTDGRPFFIVPWLNRVLVGTTDIPFNGNLEAIKASNDEIDYLITETNNIIPSAQLTRQDVKFTYSGVRPLPNEEGKKPGSITRKHILYDHRQEGVDNMISLVGGKLTTFRHVGEELVDAAYRKMGKAVPACPTLTKPLPGAIFPNDERIQKAVQDYRHQLPIATIDHLFNIYGARAMEVLALIDQEPELAEPLGDRLPDIKAQVLFAVEAEMAHTITDIVRRRTTLAMQANYGLDVLPVISEVLQKYCNRPEHKCDREIEDFYEYMRDNCIPDYQLEQPELAQKFMLT